MSDKMKNYLGWVIMFVLLMTTFAIWRGVSTYGRSVQPGSYRSFAVSGEGKAVVVPDVAEFSFSVITEGGTDIGKLQTDNTNKINQAISFLKSKKIPEKDIQTANYNLAPRYATSNCGFRPLGAGADTCPPPSIVGYSLNQTVTVKIRQDNFSQIGVVLAGIVQAGANNVSQLNFTLDDPAASENDARAKAITQAKAKARSVASAAGFSLGKLLEIQENGGPAPYFKTLSLESGRADAPPTLPPPVIEPGAQEVTINVTLRYEIN